MKWQPILFVALLLLVVGLVALWILNADGPDSTTSPSFGFDGQTASNSAPLAQGERTPSAPELAEPKSDQPATTPPVEGPPELPSMPEAPVETAVLSGELWVPLAYGDAVFDVFHWAGIETPATRAEWEHGGTRLIVQDNRFSLEGVKPGACSLAVFQGDLLLVSEAVVVEPVGKHVVIKLPEPDPGFLVIHVFDPDGGPASDVSVNVWVEAPRGGLHVGRAELQPDMTYRIRRVKESEVLARRGKREQVDQWVYSVAVGNSAYGELKVEHPWLSVEDLTVRLTPPAFLNITLTGESVDADPVRYAFALHRMTGGRGVSSVIAPATDTPIRLGPVQSGRCLLRLSLLFRSNRNDFDGYAIDSREIELQPGENQYEFALPLLHAVRFHYAQERKARIELTLREEVGLPLTWDADGFSAFDGLPAGKWKLVDRLYGEMEFEVPTAGDVEVVLRPYDALVITACDEDAEAFRQGLRQGDIIVAIEGVRFTSALDAGRRFAEAAEQANPRLTIIRDGTEQQVTLTDPKQAVRDRTLRKEYGYRPQ